MRAMAIGLGVMVVGCTPGELDDDKPSGESSITINSVEDVVEACEEGEPVSVTLLVEFPALEPNCPFGIGDNLEQAQGVITARVEQNVALPLPEEAVVCGLEFDFLGISGGEGTDMYYDDNFFFTFDDVVLAGSYAPMVDGLATEGSLPLYDWADVVGTEIEFDDSVPTFCLGEEDGQSECTIPPPQTDQIMSLQFDEAIVNELSLRAVQAERFEFSFITMGDNDPDDDCAHKYFGFSVEVPYVRL